jgi:hypothetical protein
MIEECCICPWILRNSAKAYILLAWPTPQGSVLSTCLFVPWHGYRQSPVGLDIVEPSSTPGPACVTLLELWIEMLSRPPRWRTSGGGRPGWMQGPQCATHSCFAVSASGPTDREGHCSCPHGREHDATQGRSTEIRTRPRPRIGLGRVCRQVGLATVCHRRCQS